MAARTKVRSTVIQSAAGFGSTVATTSPSPKQRETTSAQFESVAVNLAPTPSAAKDGRGERYKPVEILRKPRPVYSQEARRLQLEGEVNLEAVFTSSGKVLVKRVLHGLGHGLDENAVQAANTIQFHPASINGIPIDVAGVVKITFQLAY